MFERHNFHQIVDFSTCGKNTLDFVFERKVENTTAKIDLVLRQLVDVSDHKPILIILIIIPISYYEEAEHCSLSPTQETKQLSAIGNSFETRKYVTGTRRRR